MSSPDRKNDSSISATLLTIVFALVILGSIQYCHLDRCKRAGGTMKHVSSETQVCVDADGKILPY